MDARKSGVKETTHTALPLPHLLTPVEVAAILGVTVDTLAVWRRTKTEDIPFIRYNQRLVRYREEDVWAFIEKKRKG